MPSAALVTPIEIRTLDAVTATNVRQGRIGTRTGGTAETPRGALRVVDDFGPVRSALADLPDPQLFAARIGLALFETSTGARPATQVMRWVAPEVYDSVVRRSGRAARSGHATRRPVRLQRVVARPVTADGTAVVEACVVFHDQQRVRVMALRLEGLDGRWLVTAFELG